MNRDINGHLMVIKPLVVEYEWLVGGLEHVFFHILRISSSQLTFTHIFQRGRWLNHQPDKMGFPQVTPMIVSMEVSIVIMVNMGQH